MTNSEMGSETLLSLLMKTIGIERELATRRTLLALCDQQAWPRRICECDIMRMWLFDMWSSVTCCRLHLLARSSTYEEATEGGRLQKTTSGRQVNVKRAFLSVG